MRHRSCKYAQETEHRLTHRHKGHVKQQLELLGIRIRHYTQLAAHVHQAYADEGHMRMCGMAELRFGRGDVEMGSLDFTPCAMGGCGDTTVQL